MICKIGAQRSTDPGKLISYLFGPGRSNEHVNQRTVAGTVHFPGAGARVQTQVSADLRMPQRLWPNVAFPGGHVWHCSLALAAREGDLPDQKWKAIAEDFVRDMALTDPARARTRWTAVHHGPSAEGNAHIHLVVNLVREDGSKVNIWQDRVKAQKVVADLEARYRLQQLQSRHTPTPGGNVPYTAAEVARARKANQPIERVELERRVRVLASASVNEAEFVRRLRDSDLEVQAYPPSGAVTGYSVALPPPPGMPQLFFSGGKLARDLSLPRLRLQWSQSKEEAASAQLEWRTGAPGKPVSRTQREITGVPATPDALARALHDLESLAHDLRKADPKKLAALSADVAGALAAASAVAPADQRAGLRKASREVAGWAGTRTPPPRVKMRGRAATLAFLQAMNPRSEWAKAYMLRQLIEAVMELHRLHRTQRAVAGQTPEGGVRVSTASDDVDGVFSDALITTATTGATIVAANARAKREERERMIRAGIEPPAKTKFFSRFRRQNGKTAWTPLAPGGRVSDVPKGFEQMYSQAEWEGLSFDQRGALDPDKVGRWSTDYWPSSPGSTLPATADQIKRVGLLGDAAGLGGKGAEVAALNRSDAAKILRKLESDLGADASKAAYFDAGLPFRSEHYGEVSHEAWGTTYTMHFPPALEPASFDAYLNGSAAAVPAMEPEPVPEPAVVKQVPVLDDPTTWKTAGEGLTPRMKTFFAMNHYDPAEVAKLDKGHASLVIRAHKNGGSEAGFEAMDSALAAMERAGTVAGPRPDPQGPQQGPSRTR